MWEVVWLWMDRFTILTAATAAVFSSMAFVLSLRLRKSQKLAELKRQSAITIRLIYNDQELDLPYRPRRDQLSRQEIMGLLSLYYGESRFEPKIIQRVLESGDLDRVLAGEDLQGDSDETLEVEVHQEFFQAVQSRLMQQEQENAAEANHNPKREQGIRASDNLLKHSSLTRRVKKRGPLAPAALARREPGNPNHNPKREQGIRASDKLLKHPSLTRRVKKRGQLAPAAVGPRIWNLTPHPVSYDDGQSMITYESTGKLRLEELFEPAAPIVGLATVTVEYGRLRGWPDAVKSGDAVIVSSLVGDYLSVNRAPCDVIILVPDSGSTSRRDEAGGIVSVSRFIRK